MDQKGRLLTYILSLSLSVFLISVTIFGLSPTLVAQVQTKQIQTEQIQTEQVQTEAASPFFPRRGTKSASDALFPAALSFQPVVTYDSGIGNVGVLAVADMNGDGKPDLILTPFDGNSISVLLGNGDGSFRPAIVTPLGVSSVFSIAVADFNQDGKQDLVLVGCCSSNKDNELAVLFGRGDGTFRAPVYYDSLGSQFAPIAVGDVNGDGKADIVAVNWIGPIAVFLGNGDGTFQAPKLSTGPDDPDCLVLVDVNGDGKLDTVVCSEDTVPLQFGNGDGTFQSFTNTNLFSGFCPNAAVGDMNEDGLPDIVAVNAGAGGCSTSLYAGVLLGSGDGTFQPEVDYALGQGASLGKVILDDLDGDGHLDAIVTNGLGSRVAPATVTIARGNGDGTFQLPPIVFTTGANNSNAIVAADLNGDGLPDLVVANGPSPLVSVLLNDTTGISRTPTTTLLASSLNPSVYGQAVTYTAAVSATNGAVPMGTVLLFNGSTMIGSAALSNGKAAISVSGVPAGSDSITAAYQATAAFVGSTSSPVLQVVSMAPSSTLLTSSVNPASTGQSITYTATVSGQYGGLAKGSVTFYSGTQLLGTASLTMTNVATVTTSFSTAGNYAITARYGGGKNVSRSTSAVLNQTITTSTTTALTSTPNPSEYLQSVTFTATVNSVLGPPPDGKSVTFYNGTALLGASPLTAGVATLAVSSLGAGTSTITATYVGDSNFTTSTSPGLNQVVNVTTKFSTSTSLSSNLNPSIYGQNVTFAATVTSSGGPVPSGKVGFKAGSISLGSAPLDSSGVATLAKSKLDVDTYPVTAIYKGDVYSLGSISPVLNQVVNQATSTATLTSSPNPSSLGEAVTFTAKIASDTIKPKGDVTFTAGDTILATVELTSGKATFTSSSLPAGSTIVTVAFEGDADIQGSSASTTQVVQ